MGSGFAGSAGANGFRLVIGLGVAGVVVFVPPSPAVAALVFDSVLSLGANDFEGVSGCGVAGVAVFVPPSPAVAALIFDSVLSLGANGFERVSGCGVAGVAVFPVVSPPAGGISPSWLSLRCFEGLVWDPPVLARPSILLGNAWDSLNT